MVAWLLAHWQISALLLVFGFGVLVCIILVVCHLIMYMQSVSNNLISYWRETLAKRCRNCYKEGNRW